MVYDGKSGCQCRFFLREPGLLFAATSEERGSSKTRGTRRTPLIPRVGLIDEATSDQSTSVSLDRSELRKGADQTFRACPEPIDIEQWQDWNGDEHELADRPGIG